MLTVIPVDPRFTPQKAEADAAALVLKKMAPASDQVTAETFACVEFVDPSGNFEKINCPACGTALDLDWWAGQMDRASRGQGHGFGDLSATLPCCTTQVSLNELDYSWPAGFANFALQARNPGRGWLDDDELGRLADVLGCPVRQIIGHY